MKGHVIQALAIIVVSVFVAITVNSLVGNRIPLQGSWPSIVSSDSIVIPPSADEGDPPFITLDEAAAKYQLSSAIFIDSRDPEDYAVAHIKGAINIPYDYFEDYWDEAIENIPREAELVIYCSGTECELSLFLGREFAYTGYEKVYIFYGGWREWEKADLPIEEGR